MAEGTSECISGVVSRRSLSGSLSVATFIRVPCSPLQRRKNRKSAGNSVIRRDRAIFVSSIASHASGAVTCVHVWKLITVLVNLSLYLIRNKFNTRQRTVKQLKYTFYTITNKAPVSSGSNFRKVKHQLRSKVWFCNNSNELKTFASISNFIPIRFSVNLLFNFTYFPLLFHL